MTQSIFKSHMLKIIYLVIVMIFLIPLYMYFSQDVQKLKSHFPHRSMRPDTHRFAIMPGRPKGWVSFNQISPFARWAIILSEDWSFYQHDGVDVKQIKIALNDMIEEKKFRGASTITQQMVKNVYLSSDRTIWRKIHEMILSKKVENVLSKERILEIYLNVIEFGPGIYGIKKASNHYFQKSPNALNAREGAFLAMLLPGPKRFYISFRNKRLTSAARKRVQAILVKMRMGKVISPEQFEIQSVSKMNWEQ